MRYQQYRARRCRKFQRQDAIGGVDCCDAWMAASKISVGHLLCYEQYSHVCLVRPARIFGFGFLNSIFGCLIFVPASLGPVFDYIFNLQLRLLTPCRPAIPCKLLPIWKFIPTTGHHFNFVIKESKCGEYLCWNYPGAGKKYDIF